MDDCLQVCEIYRLGEVPYETAWKLQDTLAEEVGRGERPATLLLLEHPHTYTFGRRGDAKNLLWDEHELEKRGIAQFWVDRGGDVTYHGPGQLVGYPILPLKEPGAPAANAAVADYVGYLRKIETTLIWTLAKFGLISGQMAGKTGVWIQPDVASRCVRCDPRLKQAPSKIASIGVKVDVHGVTRHGFALNVAPDMDYWQGIVPCGLAGVEMVSLADLLEPVPTLAEVMDRLTEVFCEVFGFRPIPMHELFDSKTEIH
jgi:lipoate-protein ligase B